MRFMVIVKATPQSEGGALPDKDLLSAMSRFNEDMAKAGILLAAEGLQATDKGSRLRFDGPKRTVTDGPFTETKELIGGFWIIQTRSKDEAIEWMSRAPFDGGTEIEIRQVFEAADFPAESFSDDEKAREQFLRDTLSRGAR